MNETNCQLFAMQTRAPKRHAMNPIKPPPLPYAKGTFEAAWLACEKRVSDKGFVALLGERGLGKTQLAVEVMRAHWALKQNVRFVTADDFFIHIRKSYGLSATVHEDEVMKEYTRPDLLVIDEVGKRAETDWENQRFFSLMNKRYNDMKATILIANRKASEFDAAVGDSIASRFNECGGIIECTWETFR